MGRKGRNPFRRMYWKLRKLGLEDWKARLETEKHFLELKRKRRGGKR